MTQKLVVIHVALPFFQESDVREYLIEYTKSGWRIVSVSAAGAGQQDQHSFLVAVVLEKSDEA